MSLLSRLRDLFTPSKPLRNKPGGMAWVRGIDRGYGADVLNGRAVKTVCLMKPGIWQIEPEQHYIATRSVICSHNGARSSAGDQCTVMAIADECLEPWKDTGLKAGEVAELYAPRAPRIAPTPKETA